MEDRNDLLKDEVGEWAKEKHARLRKYIDISRAARRKFVNGLGGATYIDLYCGAGQSVVRGTLEEIDGSSIVSFRCASEGQVPFSEIHIADASAERCLASEQRLYQLGARPNVEIGTAEVTAPKIVNRLNPYGLHFAFLDPFNLDDLPFSVIETFSRLKHIDMLLHISVQDLQRNFDRYSSQLDSPLDRFAPGWRSAVSLTQNKQSMRADYIGYWASKLEQLGLSLARYELVAGKEKNQRLYWLPFASKNELANILWVRKQGVMATSGIEWTESTWNPLAGCKVISPGCTNCYAMRMGARLQAMGMAKYAGTTRKSGKRHVWTGKVNADLNALTAPLNWRKPQRVFVNSMSDLFQENADEKFIRKVGQVMDKANWHSFQVLTKRPERMLKLLSKPEFPLLPNVWLGTSVESEDYLERIDLLRRVPARVRFISFEPLLSPIIDPNLSGIHWAIVGGESGPGARPMESWWAEELRDACQRQRVAFFFKQWGGKRKKSTGRVLGDRTWDEYPSVVSL